VLLADGAGAVVVTSKKDRGGILSSRLKSDGTLWELLYSSDGNSYIPEILQGIDLKPLHLEMDGNRLFKKAIEYMSTITQRVMQDTSLSSEEIQLVIPHQANIRIIQGLAKSLKVPMEKVYTNIHKYGNTSSATIPIALDEANREGLVKKGENVLLVSFGSGLTWGASILNWSF
jgi:3-oxoacyl-[acyl-carrier-protein] synthase-3